tara:strand:+ start:37 stop:939 length:903 start_codon:yes stop_codon:yes gene_type:complete
MNPQIGDVSEDGYWILTADGWQPSEMQVMALSQGAIPHNTPQSQQIVMTNYSVERKVLQSSDVMKYIFSGAIALALILLLIGMYHDSWTGPGEDAPPGMQGGLGLTGATYDCSDVTGTDSDGDSNKEICKFGAGLGTGEITPSQALMAESLEGLVEDLPDEMSGDMDIMCNVMKELSEAIGSTPEDIEDIENCQDRSTAGTTAIVFFWFSFIGALVTGIIVVTSLYQTIPYSNEVEKYGILASAVFALLGFVSWLILKPEATASFGPAFYITIFSILLLAALAVIQFVRPKAIGNLALFE